MNFRTWFGRAAATWDVLTVVVFALFVQSLLLGGIRILWLSGGEHRSAGLFVVVAEEGIDPLAAHLRQRAKDEGDQLLSMTRWERPFYAFLGLLLARLVLTLALAPPDYRARFATGWRRLVPRLAASFWLFLVLLAATDAWIGSRNPPPSTSAATDLIQPGSDGARPTLQPGARAEHSGAIVEVNQLGFRGPEIPARSAGPRVFYLGDSFTFGFGVEDAECFVRRSEAHLRQAGLDATVVNGGMWSYDTADEIRLLEARVDDVDPDVVVLVFFMNDGMPNITLTRLQRRLYQEIAIYRRLFDVYYTQHAVESKYTPESVNGAYRDGMPSWEESKTALARFRELADQRGFRPLVVIFPLLENLDQEGAYEPAHQAVGRAVAALDIPCLDLAATFAGRDAKDLWFRPDDHHPNVEGHALAAGAIGPWLEGHLRERE